MTNEPTSPLPLPAPEAPQSVVTAQPETTYALEKRLLGMLGTVQAISPPLLPLAVFVLVGGALTVLRVGSPILNPIIPSLCIVMLTLPVYRWLKRSGINSALVPPLIVSFVLIFGLGLSLLAWFSVTRLIHGLGEYTQLIDSAVDALARRADLGADGAPGRAAAALMAMSIAVLLLRTFQRYESTRWVAQLIGTAEPWSDATMTSAGTRLRARQIPFTRPTSR